LDTLDFLYQISGSTDWVIGEIDGFQTTLLESLKVLKIPLETKHLSGFICRCSSELFNIFFNVYGRHLYSFKVYHSLNKYVMTVLTRTGYLVDSGPIQEIKKELTVRPIVNGDFGFPPPPFKVFKPAKNGVCVPRFYGTSKLGEPKHDNDQNQLIKQTICRATPRCHTPKRSIRSSY
jgi:hypothetical protein